MLDLIKAILLAVIILIFGMVFTFVGALIMPVFFFGVVIFVCWILIQIVKDNDADDDSPGT